MKGAGALLTGAAVALGIVIYVGSRSRSALAPADFTADGPDALEFCSDVRPKFIPVANKVSPVVLTVVADRTIRLSTAAGKRIGPHDLARMPRLFAVNGDASTLRVFRPLPSATYGDWRTPTLAGVAKIFADIVPMATGREMYVEAAVHPAGGADISTGAGVLSSGKAPSPRAEPREPSAAPLGRRQGPGADEGAAPRKDAGSGWGLSLNPPQALVRDPVQFSFQGPLASRVAEVAVFDLGTGGATGFAIVKVGMPLTFDDPGNFAVWVLGAEGESLHRFTLSVSP